MVYLQELPFDVLLHILSFLKPRDTILGFRQTCSAMRDASTNSSVWKIILRRICVENSIFLPSAILNNMPLLELEHAATGPSRFISHVRNLSSGGMIKSYSKHYLSTSLRVLDNPQNDDEEISHIYLIPGGQFLISHHVSQLRMWDIGPPGTNWGPTPFLSPLAILNRYCKNAYVAHSTRDGEGLIILACTSDPWDIMDSERELSVFEIYPAASSPSFREIASHVARVEPGNHEQYCLTVDKLIFLFNAEISVWDFIADTKATWALPVAPGKFKHISTIGDYVMLCDSTGISLWMIPPLYPCSSQLANQVQDIEPHYRCGTGTMLGPDALYDFDPLSDWYHGMGQPFILDINISVDAIVKQNRHLLEFPILSKDRPPTEPPIKVHKRMQAFFPEGEGYLEDYRVSDGHVVLYWSAKFGLNIQTAPFDAAGESHEDSGIHSISVVYPMPVVGRFLSTLCSATGRMCRVLGPMVEIVDFLEPPWSMSYD